jgi:cytochrome c oxidase subunit 2
MQSHHVLDTAGSDAIAIGHLWWGFLGITTVVYLLVILALVLAMRRARRGTVDGEASQLRSDDRARLAVGAAMAASVVILLGLLAGDFVFGRDVLEELTPKGDPVRIRITAHQFWWQVEYDDDIPSQRVITANEITVPVGQPIQLTLRSQDVIHSFWLPALAGKKDLIPGITNTLRFNITRPGVYEGQCAEFCGYQHANMRTLMRAVPADEFETWKAQQREPGASPATPQQARGRDVFVTRSCVLCHAVQGTTASATNGPDLTHFGSRRYIAASRFPNDPAHLAAWISDPQGMKPGSNMPPTPLSAEELGALVAYLGSLR